MRRRRQPWGMPTGRRGYGAASRPPGYYYPRIIVLTILLLLGGVYLALTVFSHILADLYAGPNPDPRELASLSSVFQRAATVVIVLMIFGLLVWLLYVIDAVVSLLRRPAPVACPRCGVTEAASLMRFAHQPVAGTGWETITCPQCGHEWHGRV